MFYILSQGGMSIIPVSEHDVILASVGYPKVNEFNIAVQHIDEYLNCDTPRIFVGSYKNKAAATSLLAQLCRARTNASFTEYFVMPEEDELIEN